MALNCKPGDLAVVINPRSRNYGRFVEVLRPDDYVDGWEPFNGPCWVVRAIGEPLTCDHGGLYRERPFADCRLRPIRPNDGEDEILRIAGKPIKETA